MRSLTTRILYDNLGGTFMRKRFIGIITAAMLLLPTTISFAGQTLPSNTTDRSINTVTSYAQAIVSTPTKKVVKSKVAVKAKAIASDDSITMKVVIKNSAKKSFKIKNTSGQQYDFQLLDANKKVLYTWSADKMFVSALSTTTVKAGKTVVYSETLTGEAYQAIKDKIVYVRAYITGESRFVSKKGYCAKVRKSQSQSISVSPSAIVKVDSIEMKVAIENPTESAATIDCTSGKIYEFELLDADRKVLYKWSDDQAFIDVLTTTTIEPGVTIEYSEILSGDAYKAIKDKVVYMKAYITGKANFVDVKGYEIKLK